MRIRSLKFKKDKLLGDLELNFVNPETGHPYSVIVLVGENGTGKTTILRAISDYINGLTFFPFDYIEYEVDGKVLRKEHAHREGRHLVIKKDLAEGKEMVNDEDDYANDGTEITHYACAFSKARADYSTSRITNVSNATLDTDTHDADTADDYTSLKQLIVDIDNQDNYEYAQRNKVGVLEYAKFLPMSQMYRFTNAFNSFFDNIVFDKVKNVGEEKVIVFNKNGKEVPIDGLSTGEKQIVFRGAYLLKNSGKMENGVVLIDEPELSMHPLWQRKILEYYCDLFKAPGSGNINVQIIFASHSEYVVSNAIERQSDAVVIVLKNNDGVISSRSVTTPFVLPTLTAAEVNYVAFNVSTIDYHIALYGEIQRKYNKQSIAECDRFIETCSPFYDMNRHERITTHPVFGNQYKTLPTKVRNSIDHPDSAVPFSAGEMEASIALMRDILINVR